MILKDIPLEGYEKIVHIQDEKTGLNALICIHSTTLGLALGGLRVYPYPTFEAALTDVSRLAKAMTYKSALAETGFGGGKSVMICDPKALTKGMLQSYADGDALKNRGILYAPDFVINAGGVINVCCEFDALGYNAMDAREKVDCIFDTLSEIFKQSEKSTNAAAKILAEHRPKHLIGKRPSINHRKIG